MASMSFGRSVSSVVLAASLVGCATLPSSGPTANQVERSARQIDGGEAFVVRPLDLQAVRILSDAVQPAVDRPLNSLSTTLAPNRVGAGDTLEIRVYEIGVSLFGGRGASSEGAVDGQPAAHAEVFAGIVVDRGGGIYLPYVGELAVAGMTVDQISRAVAGRLRSKSQSPQVIVRVVESQTNVVFVSGAIAKAGKYELAPGGTRLYDIISRAGGVEGAPADLTVTVSRSGQVVEQRLAVVDPGSDDDIQLQPGDRVQFNKRPRLLTVFGAAGRVSQIPFPAGEMTLAEAVAQSAGLSDSGADPTAVFLFRSTPDPANPERVQRDIYRLNLMGPEGYFVAQEFKMRDKDLIYVANARSNQTSKFIALVSQLFSPVLMTRAITK